MDIFYIFCSILCIIRIVQHSLSFNYYIDLKILYVNSFANGMSVGIGLSQLTIVIELVLNLQLYRDELSILSLD